LLKAKSAAKNLKLIQPTVISEGYDISIPMPGHHAQSSEDKLAHDIDTLSQLISGHDVIFLLTDSRESRWFPTLLATKYNKIVINSALGFDTYLVMRHGARQHQQQSELGCYFCNDIVAPTDVR
jgi:ubiquitin-like modifier-activating enzyme ATG7